MGERLTTKCWIEKTRLGAPFSQLLIFIPMGNYWYDGENKVCHNNLLNLKRGLFFHPILLGSLSFADKKSRLEAFKSRLAPRGRGPRGETALVSSRAAPACGSVWLLVLCPPPPALWSQPSQSKGTSESHEALLLQVLLDSRFPSLTHK